MASLMELSYRSEITTRSKVDWLSDRIQPFVQFKMPDFRVYDERTGSFVVREGGWIEFSLGIFLLSTPVKREVNDQIYRDVEAYDALVILKEDKFEDRYTIKVGTRYYDAMVAILQSSGIAKYNIEFTDKVLPNDLEYEPGTAKDVPLNELAAQINYTPFWVDAYGYFTSRAYISPQDRTPDYEYLDDPEMSVVYNGMEEELDLYEVANVWAAIYSNVDGNPEADPVYLKSEYTNDNPTSPTSTVSRGRRIVDFRKVDNIADQESLDAYVERIAFEASQVFGQLKFQTSIMPFHAFQDVLHIRNETLGIDNKYSETSWRITFEAGGKMEHEARRVVNI